MHATSNAKSALARIDARLPRASVRTQIASAATIWLVGASVLLLRGVGYAHGRTWVAWVPAVGLVLGVLKSRLLLERVATKALDRIRARGRASFLGFYSLTSWALIALMIGGGIALRHVVASPGPLAASIMGAVYIGIGTALLLADRVYWHAALRDWPRPADGADG